MIVLDNVRLALLVAHLIGLAAVIGPVLMQLRRTSGFQFGSMLIGSVVQLVSGIALVAVRRAEDLTVLGDKMGVKTSIAVLVLAVVVVALLVQRRRNAQGASDRGARPLLYAAGIAATTNVIIAVFWR